MTRSKRNFKKETYYHIYNRGNNKYKVFQDAKDKAVFLEYLYSYAKNYGIKIIAYCIMNNHYHVIVKTGVRPLNLSALMHAFTTKYCIYINKKYKRVGHVFQGRFNAKEISTEKHLKKVLEYLKENPIKAKLVKDSDDYKWLRV
jgi:putative transposase